MENYSDVALLLAHCQDVYSVEVPTALQVSMQFRLWSLHLPVFTKYSEDAPSLTVSYFLNFNLKVTLLLIGLASERCYLPLDGMINIPVYLVGMLGTTPFNSIFFADHIIFNNGYMKHAHTRQRMTNDDNNNKRKQV